MQKTELEKELTTADSRMAVARTKLAEYLDKWNNREKLNQEIDQLNTRVNTLKQTESDTGARITTLTDQSVKLETKVKTLKDEIQTSESELKELQQKQKDLMAALIELQKLIKQASGEADKNGDPGASK
jgi:predicted  nucleic acid-binding Zn-ribbon protein